MDFLFRLFGKESPSKNIAKERLRLVLVHDRASVSPQIMQAIREEIIGVISKYLDIDTQRMEVDLTNSEDAVALTASIPVRSVRRGVVGRQY